MRISPGRALSSTIIFLALASGSCRKTAVDPKVELVRIADGIRPQVSVDGDGVSHAIYFQGDPKAGNLFYVRRPVSADKWSAPIRVNGGSDSVVVIGNVRGPQLALGKGGRVHVVWFGADPLPGAKHPGPPLYYSRSNAAGDGFEPERDMLAEAGGLDGGLSVAADRNGNVYVTWHGDTPGGKDESERAVFVRRSSDDGRSFSGEHQANPVRTGACGCCGMRAFADQDGTLYILYRAAFDSERRDEVLLASRDQGSTFRIIHRDPWKVATCPLSTVSLGPAGEDVLAAWETNEKLFFAKVDPKTLEVSEPVAAPSGATPKHPMVVGNADGAVLLAWTEGTGWAKGGNLAWQLYGSKGELIDAVQRRDGVPAWSLASAHVKPDGSFALFY